jgi:hypothetical protein
MDIKTDTHLFVGLVLVAIAGVLIFIGRPDKSGKHRAFLLFESSLVLYPPVILVFIAMGMAELVTALLGISR